LNKRQQLQSLLVSALASNEWSDSRHFVELPKKSAERLGHDIQFSGRCLQLAA
jgi:hypothetical protein